LPTDLATKAAHAFLLLKQQQRFQTEIHHLALGFQTGRAKLSRINSSSITMFMRMCIFHP